MQWWSPWGTSWDTERPPLWVEKASSPHSCPSLRVIIIVVNIHMIMNITAFLILVINSFRCSSFGSSTRRAKSDCESRQLHVTASERRTECSRGLWSEGVDQQRQFRIFKWCQFSVWLWWIPPTEDQEQRPGQSRTGDGGRRRLLHEIIECNNRNWLANEYVTEIRQKNASTIRYH